MKTKVLEKVIYCLICAMILIGLVFFMLVGTNVVYAETNSKNDFSVERTICDGQEVTIYHNMDKYKSDNYNARTNFAISKSLEGKENIDSRNYEILNMLGFNNDDISNLSDESIELYTSSEYIMQKKNEYIVAEPTNSHTTTYNKLTVTNTLVKVGNVNGNDRYVASIKVFWTSSPVNKLKDFIYVICGNGSTIASSQYKQCYMSYLKKVYVSGIGTIGPSYIEYSNGDGSGKVVEYNKTVGVEGWCIDIPFTNFYNESNYDYTFFMQSEVSVSPSTNLANIYYAYFHQKIVGKADFSVSVNGPAVSFSPAYTMDLFTGTYYTIENGVIV